MTRYRGWDAPNLKQQLAASVKAVKKNKYGAKRVQVDGYNFDSKAEAKRYGELKLMQGAGIITALQIHPRFSINFHEELICIVELDFTYRKLKDGQIIYEDCKGLDNPLSKLKRKLVEAFYGIKVEIIK